MPLYVKQIATITREVILGLPLSIDSEEARALRRQIEREVKALIKQGITPEIPQVE